MKRINILLTVLFSFTVLCAQAQYSNEMNDFALRQFKEVQKNKTQTVIAPASISASMAMLYAGTRGNTQLEMEDVFGFEQTKGFHKAYSLYLSDLFSTQKNILEQDNSVWIQEDFRIKRRYTRLLKRTYGAKAFRVDFVGNPEASANEINQHVERVTHSCIKDLIGPDVIKANTRLILTNAIYFKANWKYAFDEKQTYEDVFKAYGKKSKADFMHRTNRMNYFENDHFQLLELDYEGEETSLLIYLPKKGMNDMLSALDEENYLNSLKNMRLQRVNLSLPKFTIESELELSKNLQALGMKDAFNMNADLSGINGKKDLYVDKVLHKAFIELSETGTEAAAASAVVIGLKSSGPARAKKFNANRPFMFVIQKKNTKSILFIGSFDNNTKNTGAKIERARSIR